MMHARLPAGIESYLHDAGFSATEMLVLKKLLEEDALTLREIAAKTGKSTGVLDQAMKKLMAKSIVQRKLHNDQPRYSIYSLEAVLQWVQKDMRDRQETLQRRHKNFEDYLATIEFDKNRPDIEYYSEISGIEQAYTKMYETGQEILTMGPILFSPEEDPMRAFKVDLFRKRQYRKVFHRIIAPDSPIARRFRTRDPFEYRRTLLVPPGDCPFPFEKSIAGDIVACIDFPKKEVSFIRFPDLAKAERASFELAWQRALAYERGDASAVSQVVPPVSLQTRVLSAFRQFFLQRSSLIMMLIFAAVSGVLTFGLYTHSREINLQRIRDTVTSIASTGALQLDVKDVVELRGPDDTKKLVYPKVLSILRMIRRQNADIIYAYIIRPTKDPAMFQFVADADADPMDSSKSIDTNKDGQITEADAVGIPGLPYDVHGKDVLMAKDYFRPIANRVPYTDKWGSFVTGYAPLYSKDGKLEALLAIDMWANKIDEFTHQTFSPLYVFIGLFLMFLIVRFWAVNRSLCIEVCSRIRFPSRKAVLLTTFIVLCVVLLTQGIKIFAEKRAQETLGEKLEAIAVTAAGDIDPALFVGIEKAEDMKKDAYQTLFKKLNDIRTKNPEITFAYIFKPTTDPKIFQFIADADSNWNLPTHSAYGLNEQRSDSDFFENVWPGVSYFDYSRCFQKAINRAVHCYLAGDQWGQLITGAAPIIANHKVVAILGFDIKLMSLDQR